MTALALSWFEDEDPRDLRRWALAATVVLGIHLAAIASYLYVHEPDEVGDDSSPIAVDFQPEVAPLPEEKRVELPPPPPEELQTVVTPPPEEKPPEKIEEQKPPPPPAQARAAPRVEATYQTAIFRHLGRYLPSYPSGALSRQEEGTVLIWFLLDRNGHVLERNIIRGSGHTDLDNTALSMVDKAEPFPPFPATMPEVQKSFEVPLQFTQH